MLDPTRRFSSRVEDYVRYRPRYPSDIITVLSDECSLTPQSLVVDIGSGTGFLSELFLSNGNSVIGVEPNSEMRAAGDHYLRNYPEFQSIDGRAESTRLNNSSTDFVVVGQAFHWFDHALTHREVSRILNPTGWVVLVWNDRDAEVTLFGRAYEQLLLKYAANYAQVKQRRRIDETILADFYEDGGLTLKTFQNSQDFDLEGLKGRLMSSSYTPEADDPNHQFMLSELTEIFQAYAVNHRVRVDYTTRLYYGQLR
ncbi:MAG: class I SAM-dependent methyltransferase [Cyanobacteria bacterium P01_E01_bin.6]